MERGIPDGHAGDGPPPDEGEQVVAGLNQVLAGAVSAVRLSEVMRTQAVLALWDVVVEDETARGLAPKQGGRAERAFGTHLGGALHESRDAAVRLLHTAIALRGLPATYAAFQSGGFAWRAAESVVQHVGALAGEARDRYDVEAASLASGTVPQRLDTELKRLHDELDHEAATEDAAAAFRERRVRARQGFAGEASLTFTGPETDIAAWYETLHRSAVASHAADGETRTIAALMFDIALDDGLRALADPPSGIDRSTSGAVTPADPFERLGDPRVPHRKAIAAEILVTVPAETLAGASSRPGRIAGWGSLPAAEARRLVASARFWTRVEVDPVDDAILGFDSEQRAIPKALRRLIWLRSETCDEPGCPVGAHRTDLDHVVRVEHGGRTSEINLSALCRPGHQTKDDGYMDVRRDEHGDLTWVTRWGGTLVKRAKVRIRRRVPTPVDVTEPAPFDLIA